ncbi:hypothetical protein SEA_CULVER_177 [Gordonia phage Culver]|nr:hypothetical protein SEA_CULVER_177 [Gordonia phage Culver]
MNSDQFRLTIRTGNDAFEQGTAGYEIARILREAADYIEEYGVDHHTRSLIDQNGNRVGGYKMEES